MCPNAEEMIARVRAQARLGKKMRGLGETTEKVDGVYGHRQGSACLPLADAKKATVGGGWTTPT